MSGGSDASMMGYGKFTPLSNINGNYVNVHNTNNPSMFTSKTIPSCPGLAGASNNINAAAGKLMKGGSRAFKRKIKNITKLYKNMKGGSRRIRTMKRRIRSKMSNRKTRTISRRYRNSRRRHRQYGGYAQYQNNLPMTHSYSVGGILSANELGGANPPPIQVLSNNTNCVDNYNHFTNAGFASRGH